jgi:iron complex outermembrane receptor protein
MLLGLQPVPAAAQGISLPAPDELKQLSLEELMDIEVFSVSRHDEKLAQAASAIQVIGRDELLRSGAATLPEALRLAANLQVAQQNAFSWAISARGFNGSPLAANSLANKLLVMIDGRTVYTPLFGGVFWDVQNVPLAEIERIEVVSGPGGSMWGSNAVNGVINVVTRDARTAPGGAAAYTAGDEQRTAAVRYAAAIGDGGGFRVYAERFERDPFFRSAGGRGPDGWEMGFAGFRSDFSDARDAFTLQGDFYRGDAGTPQYADLSGHNVLARWTRQLAGGSEMTLQVYRDRTWRKFVISHLSDELVTHDIDFQHHVALGAHDVVWGFGYRRMDDRVQNGASLTFAPLDRELELASVFVQDDIVLIPDRLRLTAGARVEHNDYSGTEVQPSLRMAWTPTPTQTLWTAVSRAVHAPTRFDADLTSPLGSADDFTSEKLHAWELGYRAQPSAALALSIAAYHSRYHDLRSIHAAPLQFDNNQEARANGIELSAEWRIAPWWRLRGGYNHLDTDIRATAPGVLPGSDRFEAIDPKQQALLHSMIDLPRGFAFDVVGRRVGALPASSIGATPAIPAYTAFDLRLAWRHRDWEVAVVGRNIGMRRHAEFGSLGGALEVPNSAFCTLTWRF